MGEPPKDRVILAIDKDGRVCLVKWLSVKFKSQRDYPKSGFYICDGYDPEAPISTDGRWDIPQDSFEIVEWMEVPTFPCQKK